MMLSAKANFTSLHTEPGPPAAPFGGRLPLSESRMHPSGRLRLAGGYDGLEVHRLRGLIEESFGAPLAAGYFDMPAGSVIYEKDYLGAAIIKSVCGLAYLDKFAVAPEAQGKGLGGELWKEITGQNPSLMWRASPANPCNGWYGRNSDGSLEHGGWVVYWYNVGPMAAAEAAVMAARLPKTIMR